MSEVESNSTNSAKVCAVVKNTTLLAAKDLVCASSKKAPSLKENSASINDAASAVKGVIASYDDAPLVIKEAIDGYNAARLVVEKLVSKHDVDVLMIRETMIPSANQTTSLNPASTIKITAGLGAFENIVSCEVIDAYGNATLASKHLVCTYQDSLLVAKGVYAAMNNSTNNTPRSVIIAYNDALLVAKNLVAEYNDGFLVVDRAMDACVSEARSWEEEATIETSVVEKIVDALKLVMDAYKNALAVTKDLMLAYKLIKDITGASANEPRLMKGIPEEASLGEQKKLSADHKPCRDCPDNDKKESNYPNELGQLKKLCAEHAKSLGCQQVQE